MPLFDIKPGDPVCTDVPLASDWNFHTELTELRDDRNELLFNVIEVGVVCHRCLGTDREAECTHPVGNKPERTREHMYTNATRYGGDPMAKSALKERARSLLSRLGHALRSALCCYPTDRREHFSASMPRYDLYVHVDEQRV